MFVIPPVFCTTHAPTIDILPLSMLYRWPGSSTSICGHGGVCHTKMATESVADKEEGVVEPIVCPYTEMISSSYRAPFSWKRDCDEAEAV